MARRDLAAVGQRLEETARRTQPLEGGLSEANHAAPGLVERLRDLEEAFATAGPDRDRAEARR